MEINTEFKIGFACKWLKEDLALDPLLNDRSTTLAFLKRKNDKEKYDVLRSIVCNNIVNLKNRIMALSKMPTIKRMYRIGSDILPFKTHEIAKDFYLDPVMTNYLEKELSAIGQLAEQHNIRLSFHPGQFTFLVSDKDTVVNNSIKELEYQAEFFDLMNISKGTTCINIHVGAGTPDFKEIFVNNFNKLNDSARQYLAIENDEFSYGIDKTTQLKDYVKLTLDVHHHWIMTGQYIDPNDNYVLDTIESWRGSRPKCHYALSREDLLVDHCWDTLPNMNTLMSQGFKKGKLRAHSDNVWNRACNEYVLGFLPTHDIMVEAKNKNIASGQLIKHAIELNT